MTSVNVLFVQRGSKVEKDKSDNYLQQPKKILMQSAILLLLYTSIGHSALQCFRLKLLSWFASWHQVQRILDGTLVQEEQDWFLVQDRTRNQRYPLPQHATFTSLKKILINQRLLSQINSTSLKEHQICSSIKVIKKSPIFKIFIEYIYVSLIKSMVNTCIKHHSEVVLKHKQFGERAGSRRHA